MRRRARLSAPLQSHHEKRLLQLQQAFFVVRLQGSGQPGPAPHLQSVQAIVKMVCTSELSLREAKRRGNLTHQLPNSQKLPCYPPGSCEIATSACGLLAMTNLMHCTVGGGAQKYATAIGAQPP